MHQHLNRSASVFLISVRFLLPSIQVEIQRISEHGEFVQAFVTEGAPEARHAHN